MRGTIRNRAVGVSVALLQILETHDGKAGSGRGDPPETPDTASPESRTTLWSGEWARFRPWEYVATPAALILAFYPRFLAPNRDANVHGGILFDDWVLDRIALESGKNHRIASYAANTLFGATFAYRFVDSLCLPLAIQHDPELALQMSMIDLEAFGTVALVLWGSQVFVRRERPVIGRHCDDPEFARQTGVCDAGDRDRNRSFIAGHLATVLAGAGVTCMHHSHVPLYGGDGDVIACGSMIGAAGMVGALRLMTESHYPTDTVLGLGLGVLAGWVIPGVLHYDAPPPTAPESGRTVAIRFAPWIGGDRVGLATVGDF